MLMKEELLKERRRRGASAMLGLFFQGCCVDALGHSALSLSRLSDNRILRDGLVKAKVSVADLN